MQMLKNSHFIGSTNVQMWWGHAELPDPRLTFGRRSRGHRRMYAPLRPDPLFSEARYSSIQPMLEAKGPSQPCRKVFAEGPNEGPSRPRTLEHPEKAHDSRRCRWSGCNGRRLVGGEIFLFILRDKQLQTRAKTQPV